MKRSPTEKQAYSAANQLHFHRERIHWMREKMRRNEALLLLYLSYRNSDTAILPGGYRIQERISSARGVEIEKQAPRDPYEQLELCVRNVEVA